MKALPEDVVEHLPPRPRHTEEDQLTVVRARDVLMSHYGVDASGAYERLQRWATESDVPPMDLASAIMWHSGAVAGTPPSDAAFLCLLLHLNPAEG